MEEADKLCDRVAVMDHGKILALDTPDALKQSIGADAIVSLKTTGDTGRLGEVLATEVAGVTRTRVAEDRLEMHVQGGERLVPRIVLAAEHNGATHAGGKAETRLALAGSKRTALITDLLEQEVLAA